MFSALDSGSSGPGSAPGQGRCVIKFLGRTLNSGNTLTISLSTQSGALVSKFECRRVVTLQWTSIQSSNGRGEYKYC